MSIWAKMVTDFIVCGFAPAIIMTCILLSYHFAKRRGAERTTDG